MHVTYMPESGDIRKWKFDASKVRSSKAEMIERRFGESWLQWKQAVQTGNMRARRVLLWHLMTTDHPGFRWEDTPDFLDDELLVEFDVAELHAYRSAVERTGSLSADDKADMLAVIDDEIAVATKREAEAGVEAEGKAPLPSAASATHSP